MDKKQYPEDLIIEIIHKFAEIEVERKEWLRLRLVNKFFNKYILFAIFVLDHKTINYTRIPFPHAQQNGTKWEWLSPNFDTLHKSWWLQGVLIRPHTQKTDFFPQPQSNQFVDDHAWWKEIADQSSVLVTKYIDMTGSNTVDSLIFTGFVASATSSISVTFQKVRELICNAVACFLTIEELRFLGYLKPMVFFDKDWTTKPSLPAGRFNWSPCGFAFLTTCFLGDIDAVQHSLKMTHGVLSNLEDTERIRFIGLYIAVRQDHRKLISFFLTSGVKISDQNWLYVLCATVQTGNIFLLQQFLSPEYSEQRDMTRFHYVLFRAAEHTNTTVRIEMCKLLLVFCDRVDTSIDLRTPMLVAACRSNDVVFADWIIGTGPVEFYGKKTWERVWFDHPMLIAVKHGSTDIIRFLLRSRFEVYQDADQRVLHEAFDTARFLGRFDIFMDLLPYQTRLSREGILEQAAAVDHALEAVDNLFRLAKFTPAKVSETEKAFDCSKLMASAVQYQLISNVEWLLRQGFRSETAVEFRLDYLQYGHIYGYELKNKPKRPIFQRLRRIQRLLRAYNNPGIKPKCSHRCTTPMDLEEIMRLPRPWEYKCACDEKA